MAQFSYCTVHIYWVLDLEWLAVCVLILEHGCEFAAFEA